MTNKIVFENLKHRPMRTLLSVLLIGVPATLILSLVGVSQGMSEDAQQRNRSIGADIVVRAGNAQNVVGFSASSLPEGYVRALEQQPHVKLAVGVIVHNIDFPLTMTGVDLSEFDRMTGGFQYLQGGPLRGPYDVLLDEPYAQQHKLHVGDTWNQLNQRWHVAGIIAPGKLAKVAVPKATLQDLDAATNKLTTIFVKVDDPAHTAQIAEQLQKTFPNLKVQTMEDYVSMTFNPNNIESVRVFTRVVIGIGVVIAFAVVCLTMYMAVLQRTREIGILKSLGGSKMLILRIMLTEAAALGLAGTAFGIGLSYGARWAISTFAPASFPMIIVPLWWPRVLAITLAASLVGALYPGLTAASHDPIEALAYE